MKLFYYFMYYRLYKQAKKVNESSEFAASFMTVATVASTLYFNVAAILSLITIFTGIDALCIINNHNSKLFRLAQIMVWWFLIWCGLRYFHVSEKASSLDMVERYRQKGFNGWWLIAYCIVSFIAMGVATWVAGGRLGLH